MKKQIEQVRLFHQTYGVPIVDSPRLPTQDRLDLRQALLDEEVQELRDAVAKRDTVAVADALIDTLYILLGTTHEFGLANCLEDLFDEVQRSNLSKLGEDGKPVIREDGKVIKGPFYSKPDLHSIVWKAVNEINY